MWCPPSVSRLDGELGAVGDAYRALLPMDSGTVEPEESRP
jgi:hypothetical protein